MDCFAECMGALTETYAIQVLNSKSDMSGIGEVLNAYKIVVRALYRLGARKRVTTWKVHTGLCTLQVFPVHITHFLSDMFADLFSFKEGHQLLFHQ